MSIAVIVPSMILFNVNYISYWNLLIVGEENNRANWKVPAGLAEMFLDLCIQEATIARTDGGNYQKNHG